MYASRFYDYHDSDVFSRVHATTICFFRLSFHPSICPSFRHSIRSSQALKFALLGLKFTLSGLKSALSGLESALSVLESALSGLESALSGLKSALSGLKSAFWAGAPKGTKSCTRHGDLCSSVRSSVCPFVRPPPRLSQA